MPTTNERIALCLRSLNGGGAERMMVTLAQEFCNRGFQVDLVLNKMEGPYLSEISSQVRIVELGARRVTHVIPALVRYFRRERPVALMSTVTHQNLLVLIAKEISRVPTRVVVRQSNMLSKEIDNAKKSRVKLSTRLLARYLYRRAYAVVALSQGVADDLVEVAHIPPSDVKTIYNPVDIVRIQDQSRESVAHDWFRSNEIPIVIAVGRLIKQKDYPTLIHAFSLVRSMRPTRLVILGEGQEEQAIARLIYDMGLARDVAMLGFVDNPFSYVARSSVFVLSSRWEGLGSVIIEALAVGTPVVSTNCESGPAETLSNGKYGRLVPVGDAMSLADAIIRTLDDPPPKDILNSRASDFAVGPKADEFLRLLVGNS